MTEEMKDESGVTCNLKLSYKQEKLMNKLNGQYWGMQIATGRKIIKSMKALYKKEEE